ncbi:MAG: cupin domain-containing protein [Halodesulfurarchaeum sp.]
MASYERVDVDTLRDAPNPTRRKKEVDEAVGAETFGFNLYVADPGERLPWGTHRHPNHEELFYVVEGALEVEVEGETVPVSSGEALFIPMDVSNMARAVGEDPARVLAVGAPKEADDSIIEEACPSCGEVSDRTHRVEGDAYVLECTACGADVERLTPGPD